MSFYWQYNGSDDYNDNPEFRQAVQDTIDGIYGNGQERKDRLGGNYGAVQNQVNRELGYSKRHPNNGFGFGY